MLAPSDLFEKLEFDKVLDLLAKECLGELGIHRVRKLSLHYQKFMIDRLLDEVLEFKTTVEQKHNFPISNYFSIDNDLKMLEIAGYVLPEDSLKRIATIMRSIEGIFKFFNSKKELYPTLYDVVRDVHFDKDLLKAIDKVIDHNGNIRPDASPELLRISRQMMSKQKALRKRFNGIIAHYQAKGWLKDTIESFRNGRRVLAVPAEYKRRIRGIIHDESTTGKTAFIEPEETIDINNDIFDLETDYKREIYRILKDLSDKIRPYIPLLKLYQTTIARFDVIQAKARLASRMNGTKPFIKNEPYIGIKNGLHPLLYMKNKSEGKVTVPFDLKFRHGNRILMLSGPNAGGKSIAMKSVGLLQVMVQAGLLVPVDHRSEMGVFENFFADIGDQQSIEDDLSTYSSRLRNARIFMQNANDKTLILIDEFGSGTDPKIGGSIAEAILRDLNYKKVHGVITTHYSNLKVYAHKAKGIVNGSMTFDKDTLSPTYEMRVGKPGSSYAYEIAEKSGLPSKILDYAKNKTGRNEKAVDQLLIDLQREKQELSEKLKLAEERATGLDKLIKSYDRMSSELEYGRKKLKLDVKQQELQQTAKTNKELEKLVRTIREDQNIEKAKELVRESQEKRQELSKTVHDLTETIYYKDVKIQPKEGPIKVGDSVRLRTGGNTGKVESIDRKKAVLVMGMLRMTVKLRDLMHANTPLEIQTTKSVNTDVVTSSENFERKLDVRGMRRDEVLKMVETFMDTALVSNASTLEIIHGKGTGVLRKAVKQKVREYKAVKTMRHEPAERGGDGITIIELA